MEQKFKTFTEFYPYYLDEHKHPTCRLLHFVGSSLVLFVLAFSIATGMFVFLIALPVIGYGFAWIGHYFFEQNKPATFKYPLYSFAGDWVMFKDILTGKISIKG